MSWTNSLIRLSTYEVETLQKRVAEITARRWAVEMQIASLDAELAVESAMAGEYAEQGFYLAGFREGSKIRREALMLRLTEVEAEEAGARDALTEAFEAQKKYEHVGDLAKAAAAKEAARREGAALDEAGMRAAARR